MYILPHPLHHLRKQEPSHHLENYPLLPEHSLRRVLSLHSSPHLPPLWRRHHHHRGQEFRRKSENNDRIDGQSALKP